MACGPLLLTLFVAFVVDLSTDTPRLGPFYGLRHASQRRSAWCAAAIVIAGTLLLVRFRARARPWWTLALLRLFPPAAAIGSFVWTAPRIRPEYSLLWDVLVVSAPIAFAVLSGLAFAGVSGLWVAGLCFLVGTLVRMVHFQVYAYDVGADMLPLVMSAAQSLLSGKSPYAWYDLPGPLPLTYYPLTLLAYVPSAWLAFDPRWVNVAAQLGIASAIFWLGRSRPGEDAARAREASDAALTAWGAVYLLPSSIYFDRITTAPVAWCALAWLLVLLARDRPRSWIALGVAGATTPLTAVCVPFAACVWGRGGARVLAARLGPAALLALALIAPWYAWAPAAYVEGTVLWFNDLARYPGSTWALAETWARYVGFGGLFWAAGKAHWLRPIQAAAVLALTATYWLRGEPAERVAAYAAAAFAAFMAFNSVHWPYFYQPVIVAGLVAAAALPRRAPARSATRALPA